MAVGDVYVKDPAGFNSLPVQTWQVGRATTTLINPGEPVKVAAAGSKNAIVMADADGVIGTTTANIGLATKVSSQVANVSDGFVDVQLFMPNVVYAAKAKTASNANTLALIQALQGKRVIWDLTGTSFTVDTAASDNANNALLIVGGDPATSTIYFLVRSNITLVANTL